MQDWDPSILVMSLDDAIERPNGSGRGEVDRAGLSEDDLDCI